MVSWSVGETGGSSCTALRSDPNIDLLPDSFSGWALRVHYGLTKMRQTFTKCVFISRAVIGPDANIETHFSLCRIPICKTHILDERQAWRKDTFCAVTATYFKWERTYLDVTDTYFNGEKTYFLCSHSHTAKCSIATFHF